MTISIESAPRSPAWPKPEVIVEPAKLENVASIWVIYYSGRLSSQPNARVGLTEADMKAEFFNPKAEFFGRREADWQKVIAGQGGDQAILAASIPEKFPEAPIGIARPANEHGKHWLHNVYVSEVAQGNGAGRALVEGAIAWHGGPPVHLKAAGYNTAALDFYGKAGFEDTGMTSAYAIGGKIISQVILRHPGA